VLIAILVDHIPGNLLEHLTPRNFALSDSAEAFVFLSGLSVGAVYLRRAERDGLLSIVRSCAGRALKLYGVHIGLTAAALVLFAVAAALTGAAELIEPHGRALIFQSPGTGAATILAMTHQLGYFNILPLYIVMMLMAPLVVALAIVGPAPALAVSAALYALTRASGLNLPSSPDAGGWFFNPFAWQLIFTCGVVTAKFASGRPLTINPMLVAASAVIALAGAAIVSDGFGQAPGLRAGAESLGDFGKQNLGLARLANFAALAYLALTASRLTPIVEGRVGVALQRLGRHSLSIFAAGSLLSAGGQAVLTVASKSAPSGVASLLGLVYTLASIALLLYLAYRLECDQNAPPNPGEKFAPPLSRPQASLRPFLAR
jgi:hypothetical protein